MFVEISGRFVKIAFAEDVDKILLRGLSNRPAGRFNRTGQDALYLSQNEESARVALSKYVRNDDPPRVLIQYEIGKCRLFDLRHPDATSMFIASRENWQEADAKVNSPKSWEVADTIRNAGHCGLIDPSRKKPDSWHLTLFRWNEMGAPAVQQKGLPIPLDLA